MKLARSVKAVRNSLLLTLAFSLSAIADEDTSISDDEAESVHEIKVVGQKYDRTLQETTASVRVVTSQEIEEENITNLYDVLDRTANVTGDFGSGFNIRGVDAFSVTGGGTGFLASVYVDGTALPVRAIQQGGFSAWDVSQVEILRGPQSTLQGRNALAGAIVLRTEAPSYEWKGKARLGVGEHGREEAAFAFGGGLIDDQVAFRLSAEKKKFDGYVDNAHRNEQGDFEDEHTIRLKIAAEPNALPDLHLLFTYMTGENDYGVQWSDTGVEDPFDNRQVSFNDPTHEFTDTKIASLELEYDLNSQWIFTSITSQNTVGYGYDWDGDAGPEPGNTLVDERNDETFSQEFRFNFNYDSLKGLIGAYYYDLDVDDVYSGNRGFTLTTLGVPVLLITPPEFGGIGLSQPQADAILALYAPFDPVILSTGGTTTQRIKTKALFADFTYELNEQFDVFGGLRYDIEDQANEADTTVSILNISDMPDPANPLFDPLTAALIAGINGQLIAMSNAASGNEPLVSADFNALLPKLGATWHLNDDLSTSFTVQKGYRSGGVGSNIATSTTYTYDKEYTWNYELAFRSVWLDGKLSANANLFFLDWQDQQVSVQLSGNRFDRETVNSGESTVKGFESEIVYYATDNFSGYVGMGYSKTNFEKFEIVLPTESFDLSGREFADAPNWTVKIGATYRRNNGFIFNVNANYEGDSIAVANPYAGGIDESAEFFDPKNDSRLLVNIRTGYKWKNVGLFLNVNNLLDEEYVSSADRGFGNYTLGKPRLATLRLEASF